MWLWQPKTSSTKPDMKWTFRQIEGNSRLQNRASAFINRCLTVVGWCFNSAKFQQLFGADPRSMAAARVGMAIILILNLYVCSLNLDAFFTDLGVWPTYEALGSAWSLHFVNGSIYYQGALMVISCIFHAMMLVGYRTQLSVFMSWFLHTSMQNRNYLILNGGDVYMRMCLFWAMFMPLGEAYSIDSVLKRRRQSAKGTPATSPPGFNKMWLSFASAAYVIQIFILYYFTAMVKTGLPWKDGTAVYLALSVDQFTTRTGYFVYQFPALMKLLTHSVIWFEVFGPFMLVPPIFTQQIRLAGVVGIWLMHIGFGMCMEIGLFPWLPIPCTMILLPPMFWDKLLGWISKRRLAKKRGMTIYYNEKCGETFARIMDVLCTFFLTPDCKLVACKPVDKEAAEDEINPKAYHPNIYDEMNSVNTNLCIGVIEDAAGTFKYEHQAVFAMLAASWVLWPLSYLTRIGFVERIATYLIYKGLDLFRPTKADYYAEIDDQTTKFDAFAPQPDTLSPPRAERLRQLRAAAKLKKRRRRAFFAFARELMVLICLIIIIDWNYSSFFRTSIHLPRITYKVVDVLRLDQWWGMFSPQPPTDDGWYVIPGVLANGRTVDLFNNGESVTWDKPALVSATYYSEKWRKYMMNLYSENNHAQRLGYGRYLCRSWNWWGGHSQEERLVSFRVIYNREITLPDYKTTPVEKVVVWDHTC